MTRAGFLFYWGDEQMFACPIIAALRRSGDMEAAIAGEPDGVFLMFGDVNGCGAAINRLKDAGKSVFVHIDLIKGLSSDKEAVEFIAAEARPTGIVTTKGHLIKEIRKAGLKAVHQLFMIDTQAFNSAVKSVRDSSPDIVEIMPALMTRVMREWKAEVELPLVAAGLVRGREEVGSLLGSGCDAVAVGDPRLWTPAREGGRAWA
jgi:glycerol uptake operon antiterminator